MAPIAVSQSPGSPSVDTASKSAARRPTLVRKRDEAGLESDGDAIHSSQSKKPKVSFKDEVEVKLMGEWEKAPELIREEVQRALERHAHGDDVEYQKLVRIFSTDTDSTEFPSPTVLGHYITALSANAAFLKRPCSALVLAIVTSDWVWRDDTYLSLFLRFLGNLVSAQNTWLGDTLRALVQMFLSRMLPRSHSK